MAQIIHEYRDRLTEEGSDTVYPGRVIETDDGERWFHPDTGRRPWRLPNRKEKTNG